MTTILAADVGNTNVVLGVYENAKLLRTWRLATVHDRTEDELALFGSGCVFASSRRDAARGEGEKCERCAFHLLWQKSKIFS